MSGQSYSIVFDSDSDWAPPYIQSDPSGPYTGGSLITSGSTIQANRDLFFSVSIDIAAGDLDGSDAVDLQDAILALQIVTGSILITKPVTVDADVNGDNVLGLPEAIFALRAAAGI